MLRELQVTGADLFFVDKERIPTGTNAARTYMSDYDEDFTTLKENEFGKLVAYYVGERFATDQYVETDLEADVRVTANTEGKLIKATGTNASKYLLSRLSNGLTCLPKKKKKYSKFPMHGQENLVKQVMIRIMKLLHL